MTQDEARQELERRLAKGENVAPEKFQTLNDRRGLTADDALYLKNYLDIVEDFCGTGNMGSVKISYGTAKKLLDELNEEFKYKVCSTTIKQRFPAEGYALGGYRSSMDPEINNRCWMPSDLCIGPNIDDNVYED